MKLWDATSGAPVKTFNGDKIALSGDFSIVALSKDNTLTLYNVTSNAPIANYNMLSVGIVELALSFDGSRLAAGLSDGTVSLWDRGLGGSITTLGCYSHKNGRLEFAPSGYHLAYLSDDGGIRLWNGFNGKSLASPSCRSEKLVEFVFSHTGSQLAALMEKNDDVYQLTLWNGENGEFTCVAAAVGDVLAISDDGSLIATGRREEVRLWSWNSLVDTVPGDEWVGSLAFSSDVLAIGSNKTIRLYDIQTRTVITSAESNASAMQLAFSPSRLAAITTSGDVQLWDVQSMKASASELMKKPRVVTALAFSPNCLQLASGC